MNRLGALCWDPTSSQPAQTVSPAEAGRPPHPAPAPQPSPLAAPTSASAAAAAWVWPGASLPSVPWLLSEMWEPAHLWALLMLPLPLCPQRLSGRNSSCPCLPTFLGSLDLSIPPWRGWGWLRLPQGMVTPEGARRRPPIECPHTSRQLEAP